MSIGFLVDYISARADLEHGEDNNEESKYIVLKKNYNVIQEKYERGEVSDEKYKSFMTRYKKLEALYGFDY